MTTTDLARRDASQSLAAQLWGDRLQIVKDVAAKGLTDTELEVFAAIAQRTQLDVFAKPPQIYAIKRRDRKENRDVLTIQTSIDGLRLVAARTREFGGSVIHWCGPDGVWRDVWLDDEPPAAARCRVWRKGHAQPTESVVTWKESAVWFRGTDGKSYLGDFWQRQPAHMLAKTAETDALKKAFPNDTSGLELDTIAEERAAAQAHNAERYVQIFGDEERKDNFDAPPVPGAGTIVERVRTVDAATGEVLADTGDEVVDEVDRFTADRAAAWEENRRLVAEAKKRGVHGVTLNVRAGRDTIERVNAELAERIRNYDLDQQAAREQ